MERPKFPAAAQDEKHKLGLAGALVVAALHELKTVDVAEKDKERIDAIRFYLQTTDEILRYC